MTDRPNIERDYYDSRGFESEHLREVRRHYLRFFEGREFLVELGSGRGEFLSDAAGVVKRVLAVDLEEGMVEASRNLGLESIQNDAIEYLRETSDRPDAVFAAHLIEHLTVEQSLQLFEAAHAVMAPGGIIVIVTPNPRSLAIMLSDFWSDPTHQRLYTVPLLEFLLKKTGFEVIESGVNPNDTPGPPPELQLSSNLEGWGNIEFPDPTSGVEQPDLATRALLRKISTLRQQVDELNNLLRFSIKVLEERIDGVRHEATQALEGVNRIAHHLYPGNEIFVAAQK